MVYQSIDKGSHALGDAFWGDCNLVHPELAARGDLVPRRDVALDDEVGKQRSVVARSAGGNRVHRFCVFALQLQGFVGAGHSLGRLRNLAERRNLVDPGRLLLLRTRLLGSTLLGTGLLGIGGRLAALKHIGEAGSAAGGVGEGSLRRLLIILLVGLI